eukprot:1731824-Rhodomonas_salina.1
MEAGLGFGEAGHAGDDATTRHKHPHAPLPPAPAPSPHVLINQSVLFPVHFFSQRAEFPVCPS